MSAQCRKDTVREEPPNVVVAIAQELAKDIDSHHSQATVGLDLKHSQNSFIKDGISDILRRIGVCRYLRPLGLTR